jgi:hypothetical protein
VVRGIGRRTSASSPTFHLTLVPSGLLLSLQKVSVAQLHRATDSSSVPSTSALAAVLAKRIPLLKTGEERYVLGIVLEPETVDAQSDIYSAAEVRDAAHGFMQQYQNVGLMHQGLVNNQVKVLESYLAPAPFALDGTQVRKGTWLLAVRLLDDALWAQIQAAA